MSAVFELNDTEVAMIVNALGFYIDSIENLSTAICISPTKEYACALSLWKRMLTGSRVTASNKDVDENGNELDQDTTEG